MIIKVDGEHGGLSDPETAVVGTALHIFEFAFVRMAPIVFIGTVIGAVMTLSKVR